MMSATDLVHELGRRVARDADERDAGLVPLVTDDHFRSASLREQDQVLLEALRQPECRSPRRSCLLR
jgi:hypothetical protein